MSVLNPTTSTTRPSNPSDGELFFETDTRKMLLWDGSAWREYDNTSGATSGGGTGDSGSGSGDSGSGSGDSGSGNGDSGTGGDGGTTPGAGANITTGITDEVAQPPSTHNDEDSLGNDDSTGDIYSINTTAGGVPWRRSLDKIDLVNTGGRISFDGFEDWNNIIASAWVKFETGWKDNIDPNGDGIEDKYLWATSRRRVRNVNDYGLDGTYCKIRYDVANTSEKLHVKFANLTNEIVFPIGKNSNVNTSGLQPPHNPYVAHNEPGGQIMTGHRRGETMDWQVMERPFQEGRWVHIAIHWHRNIPSDKLDNTKDQYVDLWIDGVKQATSYQVASQQQINRYNNVNTHIFVDNFIVGGHRTDSNQHVNFYSADFPGLIQRFTQYKYFCQNPSERLVDDDIKALYSVGAERTNPMFKSSLPINANLHAYDSLMGDDNVFPGEGNDVKIKHWQRRGTPTGDQEVAEGQVKSSFVPTPDLINNPENFVYEAKTYNKPYTFGLGTWKGQDYSDGHFETGFRTTMTGGGSVMMWVNVSNVDKLGIQYLFGSRNNPNALDRDGNNPDQFAIAIEDASSSTACRFKLYYMQEDGTAPVYEVQSNEWHCIAFVVDPSNSKATFYYNGSVSKTFTAIQSQYSGSSLPPFYIGDANGGQSKMEGLISRVHYWDGVWTDQQVEDFYFDGPSTNTQAHVTESTLDYLMDGRLVNNGSGKSLYPKLTYTGTGQPKYARNRPY